MASLGARTSAASTCACVALHAQQRDERRGLVDVILRWVHDALITCHAAPGLLLVGERRLSADPRLAAHYHGIDLALLEAP